MHDLIEFGLQKLFQYSQNADLKKNSTFKIIIDLPNKYTIEKNYTIFMNISKTTHLHNIHLNLMLTKSASSSTSILSKKYLKTRGYK
jgi:hypothetical protein